MKSVVAGRPLHIVYVWDSEYPWDVRVEKTCLALTEAGHDVHIVARNRKDQSITELLPEATVHRMEPWRWVGHNFDAALSFPAFFNPRWRSLITSTARKVHADLIIARDVPLCPTAITVGRNLHIPVILDMAEHYPAMIRAIWDTHRQGRVDWLVRNPSIVEQVERYCIRRADHILTVAEEMSARLESLGVGRGRITEVANTPRVSLGNSPPVVSRGSTGALRIAYLGLMEIVRGIDELIDAVDILQKRDENVTLLLIGGGRDEASFRSRAVQHGLTSEQITFTGHVPYDRALELLANTDAGVLPLHRNGHMDTTIPNKLFDYMNLGLPVITSDTVPSARIVRAENAGVVFQARNVSSLVGAISALLDPGVRERMSLNGRRAVDRRYNWKVDSAALVRSVESVRANFGKTSDSD